MGNIDSHVENLVAALEGSRWIYFAWAYLGITLSICFYSFLKITLSEKRLKWAAKIDRQSIPSFDKVDKPGCVVILVHGTWAQRSLWHRPDSEFIKNLKDKLAEKGLSEIKFVKFLWGGGNALADRRRAIASFRTALHLSTEEHRDVPHFVVCHSHGGNVVLCALSGHEQRNLVKSIAGIFCLATPFITSIPGVVLGASRVSKFFAKFSRSLSIVAACLWVSISSATLFPAGSIPGSIAAWVVGGGAVLSLFFLLAAQKNAELLEETTIPARGISLRIHEKLVFVRAAGDEAAAALGMAYIIRFALLASWGVVFRRINSYFRVSGDALKINIPRAAAIVILIAVLFFGLQNFSLMSSWLGISSEVETVIKFVLLVSLAALGVFFTWSLLLWIFRFSAYGLAAMIEIGTNIVYMPIDFLSGFILFPFAPELILASSRFGLTAEASVPCIGGSRSGVFYQLSYKGRVSLNHSVYDHPSTARIISKEMRERLDKRAEK